MGHSEIFVQTEVDFGKAACEGEESLGMKTVWFIGV